LTNHQAAGITTAIIQRRRLHPRCTGRDPSEWVVAIVGIAHPWEWTCGFYPGSHPRECTSDTSETFEQARTDFEAAWAVFLSKRTPADFQAWREQQAWTAEKYRRFDRGERMPPDWKPQFPSWLHHG